MESLFAQYKFDTHLKASYFTDSDWQRIIVTVSEDDLIRAESEEELWQEWLTEFTEIHNIE